MTIKRTSKEHKMTPELEVEVVAASRSGMRGVLIADKFGLSTSTVSRVLLRNGVDVRRPAEQKQRFVDAFNSGQSVEEIAAAEVVGESIVRRALRKAGIRGWTTFEMRASIRDAHRRGRKVIDLAREFGIAPTSVSRIASGKPPEPRWFARFEQKCSTREQRRIRDRLTSARLRAKYRGFRFDDGLYLLLAIDPPQECACCRAPLDYITRPAHNKPRVGFSPSLDRIDSAGGYTVGNVEVLCLRCNCVKNDATLDELRLLVAYMERCKAGA